MNNVLAGLIGALVAAVGVAAGVWLQGRHEQQRWLRDQKLRAAIEFIGTTGQIYDNRRPHSQMRSADESVLWTRAQDARSAMHLLCEPSTVEVAEALIDRVRHFNPATNDHDETAIDLLRDLTQRMRQELGTRLRE